MRSERLSRQKPPQIPALEYAVRMLSARPYTIKKLRERLAIRGYGIKEVTSAIERLKHERLLDDRKYAEDYVRLKLASRPRAAFLLIQELVARGVNRQIASSVVAEMAPVEEEEESARKLIQQKHRSYASLPEPIRVRRLSGLLARRGFSIDIIRKVLGVRIEDEET